MNLNPSAFFIVDPSCTYDKIQSAILFKRKFNLLDTYLDRFDVLFVVKSDICGVQGQKVSNLVRDIGPYGIVAPIF